jgi:KUP system potassium uptake protein
VLSPVEGLKVAVPSLGSIVLPISAVILGGLPAIQRLGTRLVGNLFGPVMALWFVWVISSAWDAGTDKGPVGAAARLARIFRGARVVAVLRSCSPS